MQNRKDVGHKILSLNTLRGPATYYVRRVKRARHAPIQVVEVLHVRQPGTFTSRPKARKTQVIRQRFADFFEATQYLLHYVPVVPSSV